MADPQPFSQPDSTLRTLHSYPRWRHAMNRVTMGLMNSVLWLLCLVGALLLFYFSLVWSWEVLALALPFPGWHAVFEVLLRLVLTIPIVLVLQLLIHPVRTRWWLARRIGATGRWLVRRLGRSRRDAPADGSEMALPSTVAAAPTIAGPMSGFQRVISSAAPPRPLSRRRFLIEAGVFGGLMAEAMFVEPFSLSTELVDMPVVNLPERFIGMRIAQMSDLHINSFTTRADLERAVAVVKGLNPDLVLLTGDFVDWEARYAGDATEPFRHLNPPEGIYSVLGNHDYYTGNIEQVRQAIRRAGLGLLVNDMTTLRRGADTMTLIGLDDPHHNRTGASSASEDSIAGGLALLNRLPAPAGPRLLMVHNPILAPQLVQQYAVDLILSGHTHGGQFQVPILTDTLLTQMGYFVKGHYDLGRTQLYINRGFGYAGPPIRFRARPEVTMLRLVRAG